jgi:hypothetical protein
MNKEHSNKRYQDKTMQEWKDAFADLYIQMTEDIGCEDVSVEIDTENIIGFGARINVKFKM